MHRIVTALAAAATFTAAAATTPASAQPRSRIGTLTCDISAGVGLIVGSQRQVRCAFTPTRGPREYYLGTITRFGLDIGVTGGARMIWAAHMTTTRRPRGALAGTYAGASGEATLIAGLGANVLIGGSNRSVALQPVSVQAQSGLNVAVGVAGLELVPAR